VTGPAIYGPGYGRTPITRDPRPDEERALRDLVKAVRRAAAQVIAEQKREEEHVRRVERVR
jgi:hypothetical protein